MRKINGGSREEGVEERMLEKKERLGACRVR
jgi:hypothetical protein